MAEASEPQWHEVAQLDDLWEGQMEAFEVQGESVLLVNLDGNVLAYENRCPHQEWPLANGELDGNVLVCSQHRWEFDVSTGKGLNPANCALVTYPCKVDDKGTILVSLP